MVSARYLLLVAFVCLALFESVSCDYADDFIKAHEKPTDAWSAFPDFKEKMTTAGISDTAATEYEIIMKGVDPAVLPNLNGNSLRTLGITAERDVIKILSIIRRGLKEHVSIEAGPRNAASPQRLIFSVNTGRSGSKYLATLWGSCDGVTATHEPGKRGGAMNMMTRTLADTFQEREEELVTRIARVMALSNNLIYAESNPNFKTWMYDIVFEHYGRNLGRRVDILVVRKYLPAILKSIYELGWFSKGPGHGAVWLPTANGVNSLIQPLGPDASLTRFELIISSLINTEAIAQHILRTYANPSHPKYVPSLQVHEYRSEDLFDHDKVLSILSKLDLHPTSKTDEIAGVTVDKYRKKGDKGIGTGQKKAETNFPVTLRECEEQVAAYLRKAASLGIELPDLPHLRKVPGFEYKTGAEHGLAV